MAWTYSDYVNLDGSARLTRLRLHVQEVSDFITENYSTPGFSKQVDPLEKYLERLQDQEKALGGQAPRANGRTRRVGVRFVDSGSVD